MFIVLLINITYTSLTSVSRSQQLSNFITNPQEHTQQCGEFVFHSFDPVTVRLSLDTSNVQHEKLALELVHPYIEGFSVRSIKEEEDHPMPLVAKRKTHDKNDGNVKSKKKSK